MSKRTQIQRNGQHYLVSTVLLPSLCFGQAYETMIFACDADGNVTSWCNLYHDQYETEADALAGHATAISVFEGES